MATTERAREIREAYRETRALRACRVQKRSFSGVPDGFYIELHEEIRMPGLIDEDFVFFDLEHELLQDKLTAWIVMAANRPTTLIDAALRNTAEGQMVANIIDELREQHGDGRIDVMKTVKDPYVIGRIEELVEQARATAAQWGKADEDPGD